MFPTEEAADFLNSKFVIKKYNLDLGDEDNIVKTYGVKAYPTFVFLDGNGEEVSRMLGGARDTKGFISRINESIAEENSWKVRNARYKSDPSYAMEHIEFMGSCYMTEEANTLLIDLFAKRNVQDNFDEISLKYYKKNITDLKSPIIQYMLNNKKEVIEVMGKDEYNAFLNGKSNDFINSKIFSRKFNEEDLNSALALVGENKIFQTGFYKFFNNIKTAFVARDFDTIIAVANKYNKKATTDDRLKITQCVMAVSSTNREIAPEKKDAVIAFLESAASYEKEDSAKGNYTRIIKMINK